MRKQNKKALVAMPDLKEVDIRPLFPNMVTMANLAAGFTSMQFAFWGKWEMAVICIAMAAIFDALDGLVARKFNVSSRFGAELDSLSDLVSFGVAPGFILYRWTMEQSAVVLGQKDVSAIGIPWIIALFLAMCCALRLARFNTMLETKQPPYWTHFFTGLPAPAGAYVALFPLVCFLWTKAEFLRSKWLVGFFMLFSAVFMASRIPTPCFKKMKFPKLKNGNDSWVSLGMAAFVALLIGFLITDFWAVISILGIVYLIMLPLGIRYFLKEKKRYENK